MIKLKAGDMVEIEGNIFKVKKRTGKHPTLKRIYREVSVAGARGINRRGRES